jgi:antitoxin component of MazEF toxin-antitoxin module
MRQKVMKIGNSLGVTVPADFVKAVGIQPQDTVEVKKIAHKNQLIYQFSGIQQLLITSDILAKTHKRGKKIKSEA